ncbi:alpha/beta hydrolase [Streptomyces sp. DSM 44917]|uniref:Alpha/beta hydrolase n=1 Tax=Streptomyces boetiae TaxID=3075541 RepID=A0ABU2LDB7_9ACTN|nr:alpha/beta hydrolase [Streptomyces sp. DSM 44917]MDT0309571.1 alpha/beta hydrolase [Streptomyces sp. DSM 44917]
MSEYRAGGRGPKAAFIRLLSRIFVRTTLAWWPLRGPLARLMPVVNLVFRPLPRLRATELERVDGGTWRGELVRPRGTGAQAPGGLLYLHGGAFVFCGLATHRRVVERLALRTGLPVLSVDYRQLPHGLLDDSIADALDAYRLLAGRVAGGGSSVVCVGDSAGGHLAFAVALEARRQGLAGPGGVVGLSPWLDFDSRAKAAHPNARKDVFIPAKRLDRVGRLCTGTAPGSPVDPRRSPVNADLAGFPPVLIQCAEDEVLRVDAELMAERLADAGVPHTLQVWEGQVHAFTVLAHALPETRAALNEVAAFVTRTLGTAPPALPAPRTAPGRARHARG